MTYTEIMAVTSLIGTAIALLSIFYVITVKFTRIETKVDTMWAFQMRRAFSEVVDTGIGTLNSPLQFKPEVMHMLDPIKDELVAFQMASTLQGRTDSETLLEIERVFGNRLLTSVCVPAGLSHGACLLLALAVAKGSDTIETDLVHVPSQKNSISSLIN